LKQATLHQLKVFEAVARHNSFTRAAEELFLTQPTVSMQVKQLTKAVGMPLFDQVGKRLVPYPSWRGTFEDVPRSL
jgi:DNA-binding transcriptional LysR family regulator